MASWSPLPGQQAFLEAKARTKVLVCGRRWGKTEVTARDVFRHALRGRKLRQVILAPSYDQARLIFERVLLMLWRGGVENVAASYDPYPRIELDGGIITARSAAREGMFLRGQGAERVVVDEAAYVPEKVIMEVVMPMLAETRGDLVLLSTPCGKNHFHRMYREGQGDDPNIWSLHSRTDEQTRVPRTYLTEQRRLLTDRQYRVEYNAEFLENAHAVFLNDWIETAMLLRYDDLLAGAPCVMGVDWARYHDYTAVVTVQGSRQAGRIVTVDRFNRMSWTDQLERVAERAALWGVRHIVCDRTSVGDPLLEQLQRRLPRTLVEGITFTVDSKRALIDRLALMFQNRQLQILPEMELLRELHHFEALTGETGNTRLAAQPGYHDDLVCALALAVSGLTETAALPRIGLGGSFHPI